MSTSLLETTIYPATSNGADLHTDTTFDVINPATGKVFAQAPAVTTKQLDVVFASADRAFHEWKRNEKARQTALFAAADAIDAASAELSAILTAEQGKPLADSQMEVAICSLWLRYYAALEMPRELVQDDDKGYAEVFRVPMGVVAAVTPWNFPLILAMTKIAPALRAGNTIVVKPSPYTPLSSLVLGRVLRGVFPDGVLNIVSGPDPLGNSFTTHPVPRKISFTGSTATGRKVMSSAVNDLKRFTLELGGNDPAILLEDVNVAEVAETLFWGAFANCGQVCMAVKRVYAHEKIHAQLVEALAAIAKSVKVGDGAEEGVKIGPLNNKMQLDRVDELVNDALKHGARAVTGGKKLARPGYFFEPTIIDNISDGVRLVDEEQFGPALPVLSFKDEADVIARANRGEYGLTASVWSSDVERAIRVATELDCGQTSINRHMGGSRPDLPFSGHKWSGIGVECGPWGLESFTEFQVITSPARKPKS